MVFITSFIIDFNVVIWQNWMISMAPVAVTIVFAFIVYRRKTAKLQHRNNALQQQIVECKELLDYAKESERKIKENREESERSKNNLLSKLSHEIRTPMNGVIGMASLLSETGLNEEQKEYVETIIQSSEKLMAAINNILVTDVISYSENETGRSVSEEKEYNLRNNIESVLQLFAGKAAETGVELIYFIETNVPNLLVGDEMRLRQILMNLVENAMRFTSKGEIVISVSALRLLEASYADLAFEIRDTGIGLPAADVELLSKEIADVNTTKEGDALPLMICKKLVALMGGQLEIETIRNIKPGTVIRFTIRTCISLQPQRNTLKLNSDFSKKSILLVDDNITARNAMRKQLENWNVVVTEASAAEEAMDIFAHNPHFELIITDLQMPQVNGIELTSKIKNINPNAAVVLLNQYGNEQYKKQQNWFTTVITKPVRQQALYECLQHQFAKDEAAIANKNKSRIPSDTGTQYPLRILVAEDNKTNQDVALKFLSKLGYQADLAQNGEEALEMIGDGNYDIIFMDVQMPVKDGFETTRIIRLCLSKQPVIVAVTANAIQGDRQKCLNAGMDDYISKPFRIEELSNMIEKWAVQLHTK